MTGVRRLLARDAQCPPTSCCVLKEGFRTIEQATATSMSSVWSTGKVAAICVDLRARNGGVQALMRRELHGLQLATGPK
jgi:hypothetical protein